MLNLFFTIFTHILYSGDNKDLKISLHGQLLYRKKKKGY